MLLLGAILLAVFVLPSPWNAVVVALGALGEVAEALIGIRISQRRRAHVGAETLIGATARVVSACSPDGRVEVRGELWTARCPAGARVGDAVLIRELDGLTLVVEPATGLQPALPP
jgi:membrane protein implicated in regulation of membrane protease activity